MQGKKTGLGILFLLALMAVTGGILLKGQPISILLANLKHCGVRGCMYPADFKTSGTQDLPATLSGLLLCRILCQLCYAVCHRRTAGTNMVYE